MFHVLEIAQNFKLKIAQLFLAENKSQGRTGKALNVISGSKMVPNVLM